MNLASAAGALAITGFTNVWGGATLTLYNGVQPVSAETALSGNTSLYTWVFNSPPFSTLATAGGFDTLAASVAAGTFQAASTTTFARVTYGPFVARANTTAYVRGALVTAASNLYVCIAPGTSSGTSTLTTTGYGIVDGGAAFDYVGASTLTVIADLSVGLAGSGADVILGNLTIQSGVPANFVSFYIRVATA